MTMPMPRQVNHALRSVGLNYASTSPFSWSFFDHQFILNIGLNYVQASLWSEEHGIWVSIFMASIHVESLEMEHWPAVLILSQMPVRMLEPFIQYIHDQLTENDGN